MSCCFIVRDLKPRICWFHKKKKKTFFLIKEYLGRPLGMSNKPDSKNLLNTASFYLGGRGGGEKKKKNL